MTATIEREPSLFDRVVAEIRADESYEEYARGALLRMGRRGTRVALDTGATIAEARQGILDAAVALEWLHVLSDGRRFWIQAINELDDAIYDAGRFRGWVRVRR